MSSLNASLTSLPLDALVSFLPTVVLDFRKNQVSNLKFLLITRKRVLTSLHRGRIANIFYIILNFYLIIGLIISDSLELEDINEVFELMKNSVIDTAAEPAAHAVHQGRLPGEASLLQAGGGVRQPDHPPQVWL